MFKVLPSTYWRKSRETYNMLASLTRDFDEFLSPVILLSFANNLYFICLQLLNSLKYAMQYYVILVLINQYLNLYVTCFQTHAQRLGSHLFRFFLYIFGWKDLCCIFVCSIDKRSK